MAEWSAEELNFIDANLDMGLDEMCAALGRDRVETSRAKARIESRFLSEPWTEEEDRFVLSTPHFTARQVARQLERSYAAVVNRRQLLSREHGVKFGVNMNKSPFMIGARPLVAKTCTTCGLLLASEWFGFSAKQNGTGGWRTQCRKCLAGVSAEYNSKNGPSTYHGSERYKHKSRESRNKLQALTVPRASRGGQPWIEEEHEILRDPDMTLLEKALKLQRTYNAVSIICSTNGYKSHVGLGSAERDQWYIDNPNAKEYAA